MQTVNKNTGSNTRSALDDKDLAYEILVRETRTENLRKDKESLAIFNQGEIALDNAAANGDDNDVVHTNGHVVQSNRARNNRYSTLHQEKDLHGIKALIKSFASMGLTMAIVEQWAKGIGATLQNRSPSLKGTFTTNSKDDNAIVFDEHFIYGGENVSLRTADLFGQRLERILRLQKEMSAATNPVEYAEKRDQFERLVERSGVIYHEGVGWAFPSERVDRIENHIEDADCNGVVCTFSPRMGGSDSRRMKIDVGDQFDDDPNETIGEAKVETPQFVAPPGVHFVR